MAVGQGVGVGASVGVSVGEGATVGPGVEVAASAVGAATGGVTAGRSANGSADPVQPRVSHATNTATAHRGQTLQLSRLPLRRIILYYPSPVANVPISYRRSTNGFRPAKKALPTDDGKGVTYGLEWLFTLRRRTGPSVTQPLRGLPGSWYLLGRGPQQRPSAGGA